MGERKHPPSHDHGLKISQRLSLTPIFLPSFSCHGRICARDVLPARCWLVHHRSAAVAYSVETYLAYSVGAFWKGLANNGMTDEQRRLLDPSSEEYHLRVNGSKTQVAGWSTYASLLWTIKAAMCAFYLRLTEGLGFHRRIYIGFALIGSTWIAVLLSILLGCRPFEKNWQIFPDPGNSCQPAISKIDIFVTVVLNVLTDVYLMSIPIPMLWQSSLRPLKKAGLILLFSGGVFVTVAGILRCILIVTDPVNGAQKAGSWAVRESFVAVVTSNLPMITPLVTRIFRPLIGSLMRSLSTASSHKPSRPSRSRDGPGKPSAFRLLEDKNPRRGRGPRSVNPIPNFSVNGSDERIYWNSRRGGHDEAMACSAGSYDSAADLESGRANNKAGASATPAAAGVGPFPMAGVIVKQTSVEIIETRNSGEAADERDVGDYYLVRQAHRDAERLARKASAGKRRRSSVTLGMGRAP
ncbi:hypothetical protein N658DRAFT_81993 [Parathielavia hyrcaniae]|uniref:Rhodopsin domain-containing protein n=1 Tax=Parathielavia hyrcaniae TaxID=113614 RepID=A0AAN6PQH8_9PEZI|nr:hypothetical protein N658DRAFT_81993 [Parathielavia hyrcaniae]